MDTIGKIITHLSRQMNDQRANKKFVRWTRQDWMDYMNRGLTEIGAYRPDAFAASTTIPLVAGSAQRAPDGVVVDAFGPDKNGLSPVVADTEAYRAFSTYAKCTYKPKVVNGQIVYSVKSVVIDEANPQIFYVSPPVPAGVTTTIDAKTVGEPPQYTLADWNKPVGIASKYLNNLCDYMTALAYKLDSESQVSQAAAARIFSLFYQTMGAKYKIDAAHNSGYYKGELGTGDPRARQ